MSHTSPASYLIWAILSTLLGSFLVFHLWSFDRFKCLRWESGPYSGAFKRIMTYSYLTSIPLIMAYSIGFTVIKYRQGFISTPENGIIPVPYQLWPESDRSVIFPFYLIFSIAWSLEMVTHLEELCFWLFLVNAGSAQQDWFRSLYFKTWAIGSVVAVCYMPLVTIFTHSDPLKCEAFTFLAGSLGSLSLTLWFTPILWAFPNFLSNLKKEGVDINTIVRLTKFHELNTVRVCFRFLFTVPLLCLGVDGVRPHQHVNESMFWTDLLAAIAGFGVVISSGITLVIFFPRSIEGEIAAKEATRERRLGSSSRLQQSMLQSQNSAHINTQQSIGATGERYLISSPVKGTPSHPDGMPPTSMTKGWAQTWENVEEGEERDKVPSTMPPRYSHAYIPPLYSNAQRQRTVSLSPTRHDDDVTTNKRRSSIDTSVAVATLPMRPNRRPYDGGDVEMGGIGVTQVGGLTEGNLSAHNQCMSKVNLLVHNYTSPIDLVYGPGPDTPSQISLLPPR